MGQSWFKFWASAREDSKLRSLTDFEFRYWVQLLCLSCDQTGDGTLNVSDLEEVCIDIGLLDNEDEPCLEAMDILLKKLARRKLITRDGDTISFPSWDRRQGKPSDRPEAVRERKRAQRERERNAGSRQCHASATPPVTPTEVEVEEERDKERTPLAEIESLLSTTYGGLLTGTQLQKAMALSRLADYADRLHYGIKKAGELGKPNSGYALSVAMGASKQELTAKVESNPLPANLGKPKVKPAPWEVSDADASA